MTCRFRSWVHRIKPFIFLIILGLCSISQAQVTDQTISFSTPMVNLVYQLPLKTGFNAPNPVGIDLAQLNLTMNLFENYMKYLQKLQKIATGTTLDILYAPEQKLETLNDNQDIVNLQDTGLNQTLIQINQYLAEKSYTDKAYLLDNADTLFNIPDQLIRLTCNMAENLKLENLSYFLDSLEPDCEMAVNSEHLFFSTRPARTANKIIMYNQKENVCSASVILKPGRYWYFDLRPDRSEKYLAFTENYEPYVLRLEDKKVYKIFPDRNTLMLSMEWSSANPWLAGMVLDTDTQNRHFFVFDAEKGELINIANAPSLEQNYLYAWPYWSPDGNKIIVTTGRFLHLVDVVNSQAYPKIFSFSNEIAELVWSDDNRSFAVVEVIGQPRSKTEFDDFDLRKSILHRLDIDKNFKVNKDHAQTIESRHTIKLVGFWTLGRILYLEGRLVDQRLKVPMWDLSSSFGAFLTPPPSESLPRDSGQKVVKENPVSLPMKYLYVFKSLDGKFKNVYDAGFSHTNYVYSEDQYIYWFLGLRKPDEVSIPESSFNLRAAPYPFIERNMVLFSELSASKIHKFVKFLQDYNLRVTRFSPDRSRVLFLANFCGPLNIWQGEFRQMIDGLANK